MTLWKLTPLEKLDIDRLTKRFGPPLLQGAIWLAVLLIGIRLFVWLPYIYWYRVGFWATVIGANIAFYTIPFCLQEILAKRVEDRSIEIEKTLPMTAGWMVWSKFKVTLLFTLKITWMFFLVGFIADPTLDYAAFYLKDVFYFGGSEPVSVLFLLSMTIFMYLSLWLLCFGVVMVWSLKGVGYYALIGVLLFTVIPIFLGLSVLDHFSQAVSTPYGSGYLGLNLLLSAIPIGVAWLFIRNGQKKIMNLG